MTEICTWCKTNAGRTQADRACCRLRALAQAPRHVQAEHAKGLTQEQRDELRPLLASEKKRLKDLATNSRASANAAPLESKK